MENNKQITEAVNTFAEAVARYYRNIQGNTSTALVEYTVKAKAQEFIKKLEEKNNGDKIEK